MEIMKGRIKNLTGRTKKEGIGFGSGKLTGGLDGYAKVLM